MNTNDQNGSYLKGMFKAFLSMFWELARITVVDPSTNYMQSTNQMYRHGLLQKTEKNKVSDKSTDVNSDELSSGSSEKRNNFQSTTSELQQMQEMMDYQDFE